MFDLDSLFLESSFEDDYTVDATTHTTEEGFVWCDCTVDESKVINDDPFEFINEAMYQNVVNSNNITIAILAENYRYLRDNGYEMVAEGSFIEDKKEAIIEFFKKLKEKVVKFFETIVAKMQELQAKFLLLFKKAKERGKAGFDKLSQEDKLVGGSSPEYIADAALRNLKAIEKNVNGVGNNFKSQGKAKLVSTSFEREIEILKNYGTYVKRVKQLRKTTEKVIDAQRSEALRDISDAEKRKEIKSDYAKRANLALEVSRDCVSLIMQRVNGAAKVINKSIMYREKKEKKDEKKATGESASFLARLEMI